MRSLILIIIVHCYCKTTQTNHFINNKKPTNMKLLSVLLILLISSISLFSQDAGILTNKNGVPILPEKGDISISIDAVPFLNLLNNKGTSPGFNFINNVPIISLKYLTTNKTAIRMEFILDFVSQMDGDDSFESYTKDIDNSFGLGFGYEWRTGNSRLQGFYGIQGGGMYGKTKSYDDADVIYYDRSVTQFNLNGFIGTEIFIIPNLSVGGQFMWGPSYVIYKDLENAQKGTIFNISASNINGALMISFFF